MLRRFFLSPLLVFGLAACDDDPPTSSDPTTTTTTAPASSGSAFLRAAQLTRDGRTVDLVVNGEAVAENVGYPGVSSYVELDPGDVRVQFFPAGDRTGAIIETMVTLSEDRASTIALGGLRAFETFEIEDDFAATADRARVKVVNAVPDFPAPFDLAVRNGPLLFENAAYFRETEYEELIPGTYDLVLLRGGSSEEVASAGTDLSASSYTIFVVGSLARDDIALFVARDAP